ncbi:MAG: SIR2 family protein [Labilibaculum antarcticum]
MKFSKEIESFIKDFVNDLTENNAAVFAGAGMSKGAGYVNWPELLEDIALELGLKVNKEYDLISLAQYHVNEKGGNKAKLNRTILEEFIDENDITENHRILARLPISTFWTTNYDVLIENSLREANKIIDVKHNVKQLTNTRPKRDVVVYKMHGDVSMPNDAILTKEQYEAYYKTHEQFISALTGDLTTKTFLFIGFSFKDPNLDYVLSRLNIKLSKDKRQHYCFIKKHKLEDFGEENKADFEYQTRKQLLMIGDLKRYGIQALEIEEYSQITEVLEEIEFRFRKRTVFISGSAEIYGKWDRNEAQTFIHNLSKEIITSGFRIVNGFGWGVGSAVINGSLDAIYNRPDKFSEEQLIIKPFPQFKTGKKELPVLWEEYRQRMMKFAGIAIFIFGNKLDKDNNVVLANGVEREFQIALENGLIPIPISATSFISEKIYQEIMIDPQKYYQNNEWIIPIVSELSNDMITPSEIITRVIKIIKIINK